jgi:isoquinoline 1-oxidoreductase beta subunit
MKNLLSSTPATSRRQFVVGAASVTSGLAIGLELPWGLSKVSAAPASSLKGPDLPTSRKSNQPEVGAWVVIEPDDRVLVRVVRSEMGQGTITGLAQLVAEELECDWAKVQVEYPSPGESLRRKDIWGSFSTGGSRGIRHSEDYVRRGGAVARTMLIQAAANQWAVPVAECFARKSLVVHRPTGRQVAFGSLAAQAAKLPVPDAKTIALKDPKDWAIIGKPMNRLDSMPDKVTGAQVYAIDLNLPGMLVATIRQCPVFGGTLKSFNGSAVAGMPVVKKVVQVDSRSVAVVADTYWHAKKAIDRLPIEWNEGPHAKVQQADILKTLEEGLDSAQAFVGLEKGNSKDALKSSKKTIETRYFYPYLNHAPLEPMNATAVWTSSSCKAWVPTQDGQASLAAVIEASGLPAAQCDVVKVNLGGGFGRRGAFQDFTTQAVLVAKQMPGTPIKLIWSREEDMTQGRYHPIMMARMKASFDQKNQLTGIQMRLSGQSILAAVRPAIVEKNKGMDPLVFQGIAKDGEHAISYDFPNVVIDHAMRNPHVPPGFWRGVNVNQNAIFMECFVDEMAEVAGMDPLEFRRRYSANRPRTLAVLNAVAERMNWSSKPKAGVYRGIAQQYSFGSYVAAGCEISVTGGNKIKIHRIVAATDPGYAVNPAQIQRQVSGSFVYGLSALFEQECTVKDGRIEQTNFDRFGAVRLAQMPPVETIILQGGGSSWGGVGEPTIAVAAPAVLNAFYQATGRRLRTVPLKNLGVTLV